MFFPGRVHTHTHANTVTLQCQMYCGPGMCQILIRCICSFCFHSNMLYKVNVLSFIIGLGSGSVLQLESSQTVVDVELYDTSGDTDYLINRVLVEAGVAKSTLLGM